MRRFKEKIIRSASLRRHVGQRRAILDDLLSGPEVCGGGWSATCPRGTARYDFPVVECFTAHFLLV